MNSINIIEYFVLKQVMLTFFTLLFYIFFISVTFVINKLIINFPTFVVGVRDLIIINCKFITL